MTELEPISEEMILLTAIEKNPDDQSKKLLYADWLDEQGRVSDGDAMRWLAFKQIYPDVVRPCCWWPQPPQIKSNLTGLLIRNYLPKEIISIMGHGKIWNQGKPEMWAYADLYLNYFLAWKKSTTQPSWFWRLFGYKAWVPDYNNSKPPTPPKGIQSGLSERKKHRFNRDHICCDCGRSRIEVSRYEWPCQPREIDDG